MNSVSQVEYLTKEGKVNLKKVHQDVLSKEYILERVLMEFMQFQSKKIGQSIDILRSIPYSDDVEENARKYKDKIVSLNQNENEGSSTQDEAEDNSTYEDDVIEFIQENDKKNDEKYDYERNTIEDFVDRMLKKTRIELSSPSPEIVEKPKLSGFMENIPSSEVTMTTSEPSQVVTSSTQCEYPCSPRVSEKERIDTELHKKIQDIQKDVLIEKINRNMFDYLKNRFITLYQDGFLDISKLDVIRTFKSFLFNKYGHLSNIYDNEIRFSTGKIIRLKDLFEEINLFSERLCALYQKKDIREIGFYYPDDYDNNKNLFLTFLLIDETNPWEYEDNGIRSYTSLTTFFPKKNVRYYDEKNSFQHKMPLQDFLKYRIFRNMNHFYFKK